MFSVGSHNPQYDVAPSLPSVVDRAGASEVLQPEISVDETRVLEHSAEVLRSAVAKSVGSAAEG